VSARNPPTGCQQQCSLVVPTVRAARHLTEPIAKSPQKQLPGKIEKANPTTTPTIMPAMTGLSPREVMAFTDEMQPAEQAQQPPPVVAEQDPVVSDSAPVAAERSAIDRGPEARRSATHSSAASTTR
jgi:hypothetical protein